jgi:DUF1680 family protein
MPAFSEFPKFSRREFIAGAATVAGSTLVNRSMFAQDPVVNTVGQNGKTISRDRVPWKVRPFPMKQVRLGRGLCTAAMEADQKYLHSLPTDRLLHTFRTNAGFPSSAEPLGGWEEPKSEIRGHFVGGHYLSAVALLYASTGDEDLKKNGDIVVAEMAKCQKSLNSGGYLSAFPVEFFDRLRNRENVWVPFYTMHKIMAGLLDMNLYTGNEQALDVVQKMAGWVADYTGAFSFDHMQRILGTEYGGMGEVLSNLYAVTGKEQYLHVAKKFDKKWFFDPLAAHRDELKGLHVNTHIPQVIAAARYYELTGDHYYRDIAEYFWDEVVSERSYCTGGTSNHEVWRTDPGKLAAELSSNSTEDCCAYNMMKLTRHLFGWSADARYMDYYERTLFNHRLGTINPEDGTLVYYLPLASGYSKIFGKPFDSLWCCTGTGVEEYAKLTDTIYFHDDNSLFVNLYVDSNAEWPEKGLRVKQETRFPEQQGTSITVSAKNPVELAISLRIPYWVEGGSVRVNGAALPAFSSPSSYLTLNRLWKTGDKIELSLPMRLHVHAMPDDESVQAMMYGPLVLAGRLDPVPKDLLLGEFNKPTNSPSKAPDIVADVNKPTSWVEVNGKQPLTFEAQGQSQPITLVPLYQIIQDRYAVYWKVRKS